MSAFSLDQSQIKQVLTKTHYYIELANQCLRLNLPVIDIRFDLKGRTSGMFVVKYSEIYIRYNEIIFSHYFEDNLQNTVAHEVAHYVVYSMAKTHKVKPHGAEWKRVMKIFGVKPDVTSRDDISMLPLRRQNQYVYSCVCMTHQLSTTRHNKVQKKNAVYKCRKCRQPLRWNASGCDH